MNTISNETYFFRDQGQFDLLRLRLLPELIERHQHEKTLRIWSAGCSSGEETYSLAILMDMLLPMRESWQILILGSDFNPDLLQKAHDGRYRGWSFRGFQHELKQLYFQRVSNEEWLINERIRNKVTFQNCDLIKTPFPNHELCDMDLILCRNVFIYFPFDIVTTVAEKLANTLNEGGYLMTAHTELLGHHIPLLESKLFSDSIVYQRRASSSLAEISPPEIINVSKKSALGVFLPPIKLHTIHSVIAAQELANRGEYEQAEKYCHEALVATPLEIEPYFLLAQLAQLRGDFKQAEELLNKILYLDDNYVAAYLELAALCERVGNLPKAQQLRHFALQILCALPPETIIYPYETTANNMCLLVDSM